MSKRLNHILLVDMLVAIDKIQRYTAGMSLEDFEQDEKTVDAVVHNFAVIGEAANKIDEALKNRHSEVEWHRIIGLRNRIVHEYFGVDTSIIWTIIQKSLPDFKVQIESLLKSTE